MPLTRYQIRSEYGLADPELYRAADKDDPEALLEGVAMAGLVGILRQLGDLAEFAAEMFHDLHEEVMATASRGHGLMVRVQQLEAEFPSIEKALLSRIDHSPFFSNTGVDWHSNVQLEQSVITRGDLPRCVMDSYEECRGPPRLFLLDKFDVAGAGACLKRYTDPSFFRLETSSSEASLAEIQREKKSRKAKKRGSRWRNGGTPEIAPTSHAKLHELFLVERVQGVHADPGRLVKLKTRKLDGYSLISKSRESYMEKFVQSSVDHKTGDERIAFSPELLTWNVDDARDSVTEIPEISMVGVVEKSCQGTETEVSSLSEQEIVPKYNLNGIFIDKDVEVPESTNGEEEEIASTVPDKIVEKELGTNLSEVPERLQDRSYSEDLTSEVDNYVDAPATMESETETDDDGRPRDRSGAFNVGKLDTDSDVDEEKMEDPPQFSESQSVGNTSASENGRGSFLRWRSSYSYSDTASISTENDPSDRVKAAECLPSTGSCKSEPVDFSSDATPGNKDARGSDSREQESISGSDVDHQASCTIHGTSSSPRSVTQNTESHLPTVQSLAPEIIETDPESSKCDLKKQGTDESRMKPVYSSTSGALLDVKDPSLSSGASLIVSASEVNRYDTAIDDAIETSCAVDYVSEELTISGTGSKLSDFSPTGQQLPCSAGLGMEISPTDMDSKAGDPIAAAEIHSINNLDDEGENVTETTAVPEAHSLISVAEFSSEHSPAFGTTADESVSKSFGVTLMNRTLMPTEVVDSKVISEVRLEDKKLMGDASPTSSDCGEQLCDISGESHSSFLEDKDFHDHLSLDNAAHEIVPEEELAVSDNGVDTAYGDINHVASKYSPSSICSPSSVLNETYELPSGAGELCRDKVLESDRTLSAECNTKLEREMPSNPLEVASEGLNVQHSAPVALDDNDLANGEPVPLRTSQNQSDTYAETKSSHHSILLNDCVDSSSFDMEKPSETPLEQSIEVREPSANNVLTHEAVLRSDVCQGLSSEYAPQSVSESISSTQALNLESSFPKFGLIPETAPPSLEEMPPMPPLPPMQWRIGKFQHPFSPASFGESVESIKSPLPAAPPVGSSLNTQFGFAPSAQFIHPISPGDDQLEQLPAEFVNNASDKPSFFQIEFPTAVSDFDSQYDSSGSQRTQSADPVVPTPNEGLQQDFGSEENNFVADHPVQSHEHDKSKETSLQLHHDQPAADEDLNDDTSEKNSRSSGDADRTPKQSTEAEQEGQSVPCGLNGEAAGPSNSSVQKILPGSIGDAMWPVNAFAVAPTLDSEKPKEIPAVKLPRPRSPLVDAVAAHDRSTMRKVSSWVRPPAEPKEEDKNSFLAEIRNKSFNLKPAPMTRPNIQAGPKRNLKVAAILEKANTIRQAMAGSDEDEDSDSWSDS